VIACFASSGLIVVNAAGERLCHDTIPGDRAQSALPALDKKVASHWPRRSTVSPIAHGFPAAMRRPLWPRTILDCGKPSLVLPPSMIDHARSLVYRWLPLYPDTRPWVDHQARKALWRSEDGWLDTFRGADSLTRQQVGDLINWKWQRYPAKRSQSWRGVDSNWNHVSSRIRLALAKADTEDDNAAVDTLRGRTGGIPNWETAMASVVLAACRPAIYTVADSRALRTLMLLEGRPAREIQGMRWFPRTRWPGYLGTCRELSVGLPVRLRDLDRAFWTANGRQEP